jgi:hypothetical protein
MSTNENAATNSVSSISLLDSLQQAIDCADNQLGDTDPPDLGEYLDYPDELANEYPMVFIFHRLQEMKTILESNRGLSGKLSTYDHIKR